MPSKKRAADDKKVMRPLFDRSFPGYKSISDVIMASIVVNCESRPRVKSIMKNRSAHKGDTGSLVMASGYATNARPNPGKKIYDFIFLFYCFYFKTFLVIAFSRPKNILSNESVKDQNPEKKENLLTY